MGGALFAEGVPAAALRGSCGPALGMAALGPSRRILGATVSGRRAGATGPD